MQLQKLFAVLALGAMMFFSRDFALAQANVWQPTNGPYGGTVTAVAVNRNSGQIYIMIAGEGVFRSQNNGASWMPVNTGLTNKSVNALALNANGDLFAATSTGIFRSTNNGDSWSSINTGLTLLDVRSFAVNLNTGHLFAGVKGGVIFRSENNGANWTILPTGLKGTYTVQALAINPNTGQIFAGTDSSGAIRSANNGNSWSPANLGAPFNNVRALAVNSNGDVYAGLDSTIARSALFRSTNNGDSWIRVLIVNGSTQCLTANTSGHVFAGTAVGVYLSANNGGSWALSNNGLHNRTVNALALNASNEIFAGPQCTGIFISRDNAASWAPINTGLRYTRILSLAVNQNTGHVFAGTDCGGVFRSADNGNSWTWLGPPHASVVALLVHSNGNVFAGTTTFDFIGAGGDVLHSTDNGATWQDVSPDNDFFLSLAEGPNGEIYAGTGYIQLCGFAFCDYGDVYSSTNNGSNWTRVAEKLDDHVYALTVNASGRVIAATGEAVYCSSGEF